MRKIHKGDEVVVIAGRSRGLRGTVLQVKEDRVLVSGANKVVKHESPNPQLGIEGGRVEKEDFLHISNVMLYNPATERADKVKIEITETVDSDGKKRFVRERFFKSTNEKVG